MSQFVHHWNLSNTFRTITNTSYKTVLSGEGGVPWDGSKFDNIEVYLEVTCRKATDTCFMNGPPLVKFDLYDTDGAAVIVGSEVSTNSANWTILRSGNIAANMPSGAAILMLRFRITRSGGCMTGEYRCARLVIVQNNSTKWRLLRDVGANEFTSSTSYAEIESPKRFLYTSGNYDGTMSISFGGTFRTSTDSPFTDSIYVKIYNYTDSADVADGEIIEDNENLEYFQTSAITLIDGKEYTTHYKTYDSLRGTGTTMRNAHVIIDQSATPTKCEVPMQLRTFVKFATDNSYIAYDFALIYDTAKFIDVTRSLYHEAVLRATSGGTVYCDITDDGAQITNSEISRTNTVYGRVRSSVLTEPADGSRCEQRQKVSAFTGYVSHDLIILVITGLTVDEDEVLIADTGVFALTGNNIVLQVNRNIETSVGSFVKTGIDVDLPVGRILSPLVGEFIETGINVNLPISRILSSSVGEFVETGLSINLLTNRFLSMNTGVFNHTGNEINLISDFTIGGITGIFIETGNDINLLITRNISVVTGVFIEIGLPLILTINYIIVPSTGAYILFGENIRILETRALSRLSRLSRFEESIPINIISTKEALEYLKWSKKFING